MAYLNPAQLDAVGFKQIGVNVKISDKASIYDADQIEIGDCSRIDDFCVVSGKVTIGRYSHITPMCLVAGGEPGIIFDDFCTLAYGVKIFSQSDDYSGATLVNSTIPREFKKEKFGYVKLGKHVIVGAGTIVLPGVDLAEGSSIGAMSLITKSTTPWGIYYGVPAKRMMDRKKDLLDLEKKFLASL